MLYKEGMASSVWHVASCVWWICLPHALQKALLYTNFALTWCSGAWQTPFLIGTAHALQKLHPRFAKGTPNWLLCCGTCTMLPLALGNRKATWHCTAEHLGSKCFGAWTAFVA